MDFCTNMDIDAQCVFVHVALIARENILCHDDFRGMGLTLLDFGT